MEGILEGELKGELKGKWKGVYKGDIRMVKLGIESKLEDEKILKKIKLAKDKFKDLKEYFKEHPDQIENDDNESVIMSSINIEYKSY